MVVAMLVIGGAVAVYSNTAKSHTDTMKAMQLAQNMRAAMAVMQREIANAGYIGDQPGDLVLNNPYFVTGSTDLAVYNSGNSCVVFAYNRDGDSPVVVDDNERLGFRLSSNTVQMRLGGSGDNSNCTNGSWESILAEDVEATALGFTLTTNTVNSGGHSTTCSSGDTCVSVRRVAISFSARLADDATVTHTLRGSVQLRNHKVVLTP